jgi:energy-coupling factor transport system ATP-binding protein
MRPEVLILDEPTVGLDPRGCRELIAHLRDWQCETGSTLLMVSHSPDELARVVERVIVLEDGQLAADGGASHVLSNVALMSAAGLDAPQSVLLLRALHQSGWAVRTNLLLPEEALDEIIRARQEAA